jgi:hypothetical protein
MLRVLLTLSPLCLSPKPLQIKMDENTQRGIETQSTQSYENYGKAEPCLTSGSKS